MSASRCPAGDVLAAFIGGELSADEVDALQLHLAGCSSCMAVVGAAAVFDEPEPAGDEPGPIPAGGQIDRYHLLGAAGAGAIGIVYAAYNPRLDRKVAVKVLRRSRTPLEDRLVREARAMARVQSPHVVAVHDVGTFAGGVYVAMDFVEGRTLSEWLAERRRTPAEILEAFGQAGRGLAAAHAAGVIHRDFKPDNVLVRGDGRIAVTDFGLARLSRGDEAAGTGGAGDLESPLELTTTGVLVGTPAYMAPEQHSGLPGDARSDLFSFCVALYAALFGQHPFPTESMRALAEAAALGQVHVPREGKVAGHVRDAVLAGLRPRPEDRPASMAALLARLERDPHRRLRRGAAVVALPLVALAVALTVALRRGPEVCGGAEKALAGIWDGSRRAALQKGFAASDSPIAGQTAAVVERVLDGYQTSWVAAYRDACEATRVQGEQSEAMLDQRMACLDERRLGLAELVGSLAAASRAAVEKAAQAAYELPPVQSCANPRRLSGAAETPTLSAYLPLITLARASTARAAGQASLGEFELAARTLAPALVTAQATGYRTLEAEARLVQAIVFVTTDKNASDDSLHRAAIAAERIGRLDLEAKARLMLARNLGWQLRIAEALRSADYAEAVVNRLGNPLFTGELMVVRGAIYSFSDEPRRALPLEEAALRVFESHFGPQSVQVARVEMYLGIAYYSQGRYRDAAEAFERSWRVRAATLGPDNIDTLVTRSNLALTLDGLGRTVEALAINEEVLAAQERLLAPDHPDIALSLNNRAMAYLDIGRVRESTAAARRAVMIEERRLGPDDPALTLPLDSLAESLAVDGQLVEAESVVQRLVTLAERLGRAHPKLRDALSRQGSVLAHAGRCVEAVPILERAVTMFDRDAAGDAFISFALDNLGRCWLDRGEPRRAAALYERSLETREQALGPSSPLLSDSLVGLANAAREEGDDVAAEQAARRACALSDASGVPPSIADAHFALARALARRNRPRGRHEAELALAALRDVPEHPKRSVIAAWLQIPRIAESPAG